jgi:triphosphoribosyl-dephospho-CoA synthetase
MDVETFRKSAAALVSYFKDAALLGMNGCSMKELRARGIDADKAMFEATGGVNTHQGMVYSMGLLLAGKGLSLTRGGDYIENASSLAKEDADRDFGATAHAVSGFPDAVYCAERLEIHRRDYDENTAAVFALIDSIARIDDSNLLRRGGSEGLEFARSRASEIAALPADESLRATEDFDREMIERNLSPGGSADMLALAFLIDNTRSDAAACFDYAILKP